MKEQYTAKLIIRGLQKMGDSEMRGLVSWMENKTSEIQAVLDDKKIQKDYTQIYTSRLMK